MVTVVDQALNDFVSGLVPIGCILPYYGTAALPSNPKQSPFQWLLCDGANYTASLYPDLAALLQVSGDSFSVPDLTGRFLRGGAKSSNTWSNAQVQQADSFKSHSHGVIDNGHTHSITNMGANFQVPHTGNDTTVYTNNGNIQTASQTTGISIANAGDAETRPVNTSVNWIIRAQ